eukprot:scaffold91_cov127-Cylindrotheca_fusiformis.AAC.13
MESRLWVPEWRDPGDCALLQVDDDLQIPIGDSNKTSHTFGFVTFEDASGGRCYWYDDDGPSARSQADQYWDFLGTDFQLSRIFALIGAGGGWLQFLYSVAFCCSSQGLSLLVFAGDFCQENSCVFDRAAGFACAACACYFVAGIMYFFMSDYPGVAFVGTRIAEVNEEEIEDEEQSEKDDFMENESQEHAPSYVNNATDGQKQDDESDATPVTRITQSTRVENADKQNEMPVQEEMEEIEVEEEEPDEEDIIEEEVVDDEDAAPKTAEDVVAADDSSHHIFAEEDH